jgi:glutamate-1-semialdehyde aminotransferase
MADKHQNKAVRAAIAYALSKGWRLKRSKGKGHAWGKLYCRRAAPDGCRFTVYGTPAIPEAHARDLRRTVDRCTH